MSSKVGICDWGIGGLGVYKALRAAGSTADIVYFSDAGYTPYGKVPKDELAQRWHEVKNFLTRQGAEQIIVACNALSTVVEPQDGVITIATAVQKKLDQLKKERVAIIGGHRTIESGIYDLGYEQHVGQVAQPLSALVEKGVIEGKEVERTIKEIMNPIQEVEYVLMACTHYPVLKPIFEKLYPKIGFVDPVVELMENLQLPKEGSAATSFFTSGSTEEMKLVAKTAFEVDLDQAYNALDK